MTHSYDAVTPEDLVEKSRFVRALARHLVADPHLADDLHQEAMLAALRHPPPGSAPLESWLGTVVRNALRQERRSGTRRGAREDAVAARGEDDRSDEVVDRAAVHRDLVEVVLALDEPYRTAVLLRYFEGLSPRRVARRTGVPLGTAKTRLARGLSELRRRLDERPGGREAWLASLAPLLVGPLAGGPFLRFSLPSKPLFGVAIVNVKLVAAVVVVAVGGLAAARLLSQDAGSPASPSPVLASPAETPAELRPVDASEAPVSPVRPAAAQRERVAAEPAPAPTATPAPAAEPAPSTAVARGRALDAEGEPLGGVAIGFLDGEPETETAPDGAFELPLDPPRTGWLVVHEPELATVLAGAWSGESRDARAVVIAAPAVELAGFVIDETGLPLEGVAVSVALPDDLRSRFSEVLDYSHELGRETQTDAEGRFDLGPVPFVRGSRVVASAPREAGAPGREPVDVAVPAVSDGNLVLVLASGVPESTLVRGRVVDDRGTPVPGARVTLGFEGTATDANGVFAIDPEREGSPNTMFAQWVEVDLGSVTAAAPGHLPGSYTAPVGDDGRPRWPELVTVRLGAPPLSIEGRVVGPSGEPLEGVQVWAADLTFFGAEGRDLVHVENFLAGRSGGRWHWVETDARGAFRLDGMLDRTYRIEAMDPRILVRTAADGVPAGSRDVVLELPLDEVYPLLRGKVVTSSGEPVANVAVRAQNDAFRTQYKGQTVSTNHGGAEEEAYTDAAGQFELHDVPLEGSYLRLDGESMIPLELGRDEGGLRLFAGDGSEELEIEVSLRCHFQIDLGRMAATDTIRVLDEDGASLPIDLFVGNGRRTMREFPVQASEEGTSPVFAVSDAARTLVLFEGGVEIGRAPVALEPGEVTTIRP